jgi:hypothetical protein
MVQQLTSDYRIGLLRSYCAKSNRVFAGSRKYQSAILTDFGLIARPPWAWPQPLSVHARPNALCFAASQDDNSLAVLIWIALAVGHRA